MGFDPLQFILDILSNDWNTSNTDGTKPTFGKITDYKRINYNESPDWVLAHRSPKSKKPAGVGTGSKNQVYEFNLDIRTTGRTNEDHFYNMVEEVERILDANIVQDNANVTIINPDNDDTDLSDKSHYFWRSLLTVKLEKYAKTR